MSEPVGALRAELSAGHAQFAADMGKAKAAVASNAAGMQAAMDKVKKSFESNVSSMLNFRSLAAGLIPALSVTAIVSMAKKAIDAAAELNKFAQVTGVTVENLSTLKYAAHMSSLDFESLTKGLVKLSKAAEEASLSGTSTNFDALGISIKNTNGQVKDADELLLEIAGKFKGMADGVTKTALATKFFGKAGAELIPFLNKGPDGIQQLQERAKELGLELSTNAARSASEFNRNLKELKSGGEGFARSIMSDMLPALNEIIKTMRIAYKDGGLLTALWVGMGGVATKALGLDNIDKQINAQIKGVEASISQLKALSGPFVIPGMQDRIQKDITALEEKLAALKKVKEVQDAANKKEADDADAKDARAEKIKQDKADEIQKILEEQKAKDEAAKKAADEAKRQAEQIKKVIESIKLEYDQMLMTDREQAISNALKQAGVGINSKYGQEIAKLAGKNYDLSQAMKESKEEYDAWEKSEREFWKDKAELTKKINDEITALKNEAATLNMTAREQTLYKLALQDATPEQLKLADALLTDIERRERLKKITQELITPQETYNKRIAELEAALSDGLPWEKFQQGMKQAKETLDASFKDQNETIKDLQQAIEGWGKSSADAIVDFAMTGKASFSDFASSVIKDILRMLVYQQMIQPLMRGAMEWLNSSGSSMWTGMPSGPWQIDSGPSSSRAQAIAAASEGSSFSGGFQVTVINNKSDAQITTTKKQGPRGPELEVLVDQLVAKKIGEFGSSSNKMIRQNFDTSQRLVTR